MRRFALLVAGGAVWLFLLAIPALADGGPHTKGQYGNTPAECASCHRAHSATAPDILQQPMPALCYTCHGSGATGSVLDAQNGAAFSSGQAHVAGAPAGEFAGALRAGGFEYALINTADQGNNRLATIGLETAGVETTSAHSVDGTAVTMWGAGPDSPTSSGGKANVEMTCGSCHDPHGNGQYRILRSTPEDTAGVAGTDIVKINDVTSKIYTTTNYGQIGTFNSNDSLAVNAVNGSSIQYDIAAKTWSGTFAETSSRWCTTCHTRYMGYRGSAGNLADTSEGTGDAIYAFKHAVRNLVDPNNLNAPTTGILTPINTGDGAVLAGAVIGCYTSGGITFQGVAVIVGASSSGPTDCANNVTGMLSRFTPKPDGDTISGGAPRCIACHLSHGSPALMSTLITSQTSPGINQGGTPHLTSTLLRIDQRGVCQACHAK